MYAIVLTGGKQYKVTEGLIFNAERLDVKEGETVTLKALMVSDGENVKVGADAAAAVVKAEVVRHGRGKKINIFTYKAKKNVRHKQGHRQPFTSLKVTQIAL
ncbi:MAG: 50S ribosomal protein L21 [Clostridia bacterium]|nr:50S ribosomal protein L21 [Clostridia bacterium]